MLSKGFRVFLLSSAISLVHITMFHTWCQMQASEKPDYSHESSSLPPSTSTVALSTELPPRYTLVGDNERSKRNESLIYLLLFNNFQGRDSRWGMKTDTSSPEDLINVNCPHTNCIITSKKDLLPHIHDFDGVFITTWWEKDLKLPETRHPLQYYVLSMNE
jgi:hypothetical protein